MEYELRTKTKQTFRTTMEQEELAGLIDKICQMPIEVAQKYIWWFTYNPVQALGPHTIYLQYPNEKRARVIRGELVGQYRKLVCCDFGYQEYTKPKEGESETITKLRKRAEGDGVIICEIQRKVNTCFLNAELTRWYSMALRKEKHKNMLTVLKDIGFKGDGEASFVMKYADIIADLLEERLEAQETI